MYLQFFYHSVHGQLTLSGKAYESMSFWKNILDASATDTFSEGVSTKFNW